jgi:hypothetical protein
MTVVIDVASNQNINIIPEMFVTDPKAKDFVHEGAAVPKAVDKNGKIDRQAVSGLVGLVDLSSAPVDCSFAS